PALGPGGGLAAREPVALAERRFAVRALRQVGRVRPARPVPGVARNPARGGRPRATRSPHLGAARRSLGAARQIPAGACVLPPLARAEPAQPVCPGAREG